MNIHNACFRVLNLIGDFEEATFKELLGEVKLPFGYHEVHQQQRKEIGLLQSPRRLRVSNGA